MLKRLIKLKVINLHSQVMMVNKLLRLLQR